MKHLKRKPIITTKVGDDVVNLLKNSEVDKDLLSNHDYSNDHPLILTTGRDLVQGFFYNHNGHDIVIPESNPIIIYFELARQNSNHIAKYKEELFSEKDNIHKMLTRFFAFYSVASISGTFLFNSLEAFSNKIIPNEFIYQRPLPQKTESLDKDQIQRNVQFEEKLKKVIPAFTNKSFHIEHGDKYDTLKKLKNFRDEIMHTKSFEASDKNFYKELFTTSLDFDYEKALYAVRDFINYYEPNLIEECDCGKDY